MYIPNALIAGFAISKYYMLPYTSIGIISGTSIILSLLYIHMEASKIEKEVNSYEGNSGWLGGFVGGRMILQLLKYDTFCSNVCLITGLLIGKYFST